MLTRASDSQPSIVIHHQQPHGGPAAAACVLASVVLFALQLLPTAASAQTPLEYAVNARVDRARRVIDGAMWARVRVAADTREISLWLYPSRTSAVPRRMDEVSARWIYPGEISLGDADVSDVRVDGVSVQVQRRAATGNDRTVDAAGVDVVVPIVPGVAREVLVRLRFAVHVPERYGRFGVVGDQMTLAAPWYPLVVAGDVYAHAVPHRVRVDVIGDDQVLLGEQRGMRRVLTDSVGAYVPMVVAPILYVTESTHGEHQLRIVSRRQGYRAPQATVRGEAGLRDLVLLDRNSRLERLFDDVVITSRAQRVVLPRLLTVVETPDWIDIGAHAPGWTLVSEHAFEVVPVAVAAGFHERAIRRAMFRTAVKSACPLEPATDREVSADVRSILLTDVDSVRRRDPAQRPEEMLKLAAFHPAVDQILYAPQVPFEHVYFGATDEFDRFRDGPDHARLPVASGRRVVELMRDVMSPDELTAVSTALLQACVPLRDAVVWLRPDLEDRIEEWFAWPRLPVNYRLGSVDSAERPGGGYQHRVAVIREGAERLEPVTVRVVDESGAATTGTWDGDGQRGTVVLETAQPLASVQLDPDRRLTQSAEVSDGHPYADDTDSLPLRPPVLRAWDLSYAPTQRAWATFLDVSLRPQFDTEHTVNLGGAANVRAAGGYVEYEHGVGRKVHNNRRLAALAGGVDVRRLHGGFGDNARGGLRLSLITRLTLSSVNYLPDPRRGFYLNVYGRGGSVRRDGGQYVASFAGGVRGGVYVPWGLRHVTLLVAGADGVAGAVLPPELPDLADGMTMRGYAFGELLGRGRVYASVEQRWTALSNLSWNALHTAWVREVQLALFAAGGLTLASPDGVDTRAHAEVGCGLRVHFHVGGVHPSLLRVDVARPLTQRVGQGRAPVGIILGFEQPY